MKAKTFVLTGGPQSGKTSVMRALQDHFGDSLVCVPEVATPLISALWPEVRPDSPSHEVWVDTLQRGIFHTQLGLEEITQARATAEHRDLIGQDRGVFDGAAYLQIDPRELADRFGESYSNLMSRYDLVIHLETQARMSPDSFGSETNSARFETSAMAIEIDELLWLSWADHPHHVRVKASSDFVKKQSDVIDLVASLLR